jgi:imidazole glycerol-phosphate synthase subunit HisH
MRVAVIDYGMGNLRSVSKALEHMAPYASIEVTSDPDCVIAADKVVFPGQGAMPDCMRELEVRGLRQAVIQASRTKPFLGICIGLQMLFDESEEGDTVGLSILPGSVRRFQPQQTADQYVQRLKVPHMGWNEVRQTNDHPLWNGIQDDTRFYFVHSYYAMPVERTIVFGETEYGVRFACAVARENLFAVQFHPEKSHDSGLRLLRNFLTWSP